MGLFRLSRCLTWYLGCCLSETLKTGNLKDYTYKCIWKPKPGFSSENPNPKFGNVVREKRKKLACSTLALCPAPGTVFISYAMICLMLYRLKRTFPSPPNSLITQKYKKYLQETRRWNLLTVLTNRGKKKSTLGWCVIWQYSLKQELLQHKKHHWTFFLHCLYWIVIVFLWEP